MSGNGWEWVQSKYKDYPYDTTDGREDTKTICVIKVLRGGSWDFNNRYLRAATRGNNLVIYFNYPGIWFRCVEIVP